MSVSGLDAFGEEILAQEDARRSALIAGDRDRLASLMEDDIVHVHTTGVVNNKAQLIDHACNFLEFLDVQRGDLTIRKLGADVAVMTGAMTNTVRRRGHDEQVTVNAFVTQVWVRRDSTWRVASFHAVRTPDQ